METAATRESSYALGHSTHELARLIRQGQVFLPFTRQLFEQAGVGTGMRVLDVGSGAGDVSFLAVDLVGPGGRVVGVDRMEVAVEWANARTRSRQMGNVDFLLGDPADMEFEMDYVRSQPSAPTFERAAELMKRTLRATGTRIQLGVELYPVFLAAGLPGPSLRMDILIGRGVEFQAYELLAGAIQSLLPVMEQLGIATAAEVSFPTLAERMRDEVVAGKGVALSPALIRAWSRKSGTS